MSTITQIEIQRAGQSWASDVAAEIIEIGKAAAELDREFARIEAEAEKLLSR